MQRHVAVELLDKALYDFINGVDITPRAQEISNILTDDNCAAFFTIALQIDESYLRSMMDMSLKIGGKDLAHHLLISGRLLGSYSRDGDNESIISLRNITYEIGGAALFIRMFVASNPFAEAAKWNHLETIKLLRDMAVEAGGNKLVCNLLKYDKCVAFRSALYEEPSLETLKLMRSIALEAGGTKLLQLIYRANDYAIWDIANNFMMAEPAAFMAADELAPVGLREKAGKQLELPNCRRGLLADGLPQSVFADSLRERYGAEGQVFEFSAICAFGYKIDALLLRKHSDFNITDIISRHHYNGKPVVRDGNVNWIALHKATQDITHKDLQGSQDTVTEVVRYVTNYILATRYLRKDDIIGLCETSNHPEDYIDTQERASDKVTKYFMQKSLNQLVQISNRWHKVRSRLIRSADDQSTLRDFAMEGSWHQTLPGKEIKVTLPGMEEYSIVNLTEAYELDEEGIALDHCASDYVNECKTGYQVFSIRRNGEPQTTMGFNLENEKLTLGQNYGYHNRAPSADEKTIERWFIEGIENGIIPIDLSKTGEIPTDTQLSNFENEIGIKWENITQERLDANLVKLMRISRGHNYMFGDENKNITTVEEFIRNMQKALTPPAPAIHQPAANTPLLAASAAKTA